MGCVASSHICVHSPATLYWEEVASAEMKGKNLGIEKCGRDAPPPKMVDVDKAIHYYTLHFFGHLSQLGRQQEKFHLTSVVVASDTPLARPMTGDR